MDSGIVKWFNEMRGYGFIIDTNGEEVFVHYSDIVSDGYKTLNEGDRVQFDRYESSRGYVARNVKRV